MQFGGGHERERRAGTENVPGAVALGAAAQLVTDHGAAQSAREAVLRDRLECAVLGRIPGTHVNGAGAPRTPNTPNIRFDRIDLAPLLIALHLQESPVST